MSKLTTKQALQKWEETIKNIRKLKIVENETPKEQEERIARLKKDFVAFSKYYFPEYASADFGDFHLKIAKKLINNDSIYLVAALAREHGKSVLLGLLIPAYLMFTGRTSNMLLVSHNYDNACELLMPLILNLENNSRIINDYGEQKGFRGWEIGNWKTTDGCSFRAIGAGQSPRGTRNEEKRPDFILIDDIDTDEEVRNPVRIKKKWEWIEQALFPTMSISGTKRFVFAGNIIGKDSCIVRAMKMADWSITVNILDEDGKPSWPRYTPEDVEYMLSKMSYASAQKEYFNNPIQEGTVFKDIRWGKVPPLSKFKFLLVYGDPAPSNSENKKGSHKGAVLMGCLNGIYYVINCYLKQTGNATYIQWFHDLKTYISSKTKADVVSYHYMENNGLQDPFFQQVYKPLMESVGKQNGEVIYITPDGRKKPDKFTRIEGNLEPLHRTGNLILNQAERDNEHMKRLEEQFEAVEPTLSANVDGPDAVEGAVWVIQKKITVTEVKGIPRRKNSNRY